MPVSDEVIDRINRNVNLTREFQLKILDMAQKGKYTDSQVFGAMADLINIMEKEAPHLRLARLMTEEISANTTDEEKQKFLSKYKQEDNNGI